MLAEKMPSQFGDALGAFWGVGCTDEASQIGQQFQSLQPFHRELRMLCYVMSVESICRDVQPGCFAYTREPFSVVSASEGMELEGW